MPNGNFVYLNDRRQAFISSDNGLTWDEIKDTSNHEFVIFWLIADKDNKLYAEVRTLNGRDLVRTKDMGATWEKIDFNSKFPIGSYYYTYSGRFLVTDDNFYASVYIFDEKNNTLTKVFDGKKYYTRLKFIRVNNKDDIYIFTDVGVFRKKNSDTAVEGISNMLYNTTNIMVVDSVFFYSPSITMDFKKSTNYGKSWERIEIEGNNLMHSVKGHFTADSMNNIYVCVDYLGLYKSSDFGYSWEKCKDENRAFKFINVNQAGNITVLTEGNRIYTSSYCGDSWNKINSFKTNSEIKEFASNNKGELLALDSLGEIFYSSNRGDLWTSLGNDRSTTVAKCYINNKGDKFLVDSSNGLYIKYINNGFWYYSGNGLYNYPKILHFVNDSVIIVGTSYGGIHRSLDCGLSWEKTTDTTIFSVSAITADKKGNVYAISSEQGILKSTNDGMYWSYHSEIPSKTKNILDFKIDKNDNFYLLLDGWSSLYISNDLGKTWNRIKMAFDNIRVNSFEFGNGGDLIIGTDRGVMQYQAASQEWVYENFGLPYNPVRKIFLDKNGYLFSAIEKNGIYRSTSKVTSIENENQKAGFGIEITPNPAADYIEISGELLNPRFKSWVQNDEYIRIYNNLGECINKIPLNPPFPKGEITIDVSGLPAGVYFVRVGERVSKFIKI